MLARPPLGVINMPRPIEMRRLQSLYPSCVNRRQLSLSERQLLGRARLPRSVGQNLPMTE
jgi:hypothetical protein